MQIPGTPKSNRKKLSRSASPSHYSSSANILWRGSSESSLYRHATCLNLYSLKAPPHQAFNLQESNIKIVSSGSKWQIRIHKIISTPSFDASVGVIILLNALVIGLEIELRESIPYIFFKVAELIFLTVYSIELLLRIYVFRLVLLQSAVFYLDLVIVILGVVAIVLMRNSDGDDEQVVHSQMQNVSIVRLARFLKVVRVFRLSTQFEALWMIVTGLVACMGTVLWTALLLSVITYIFGVVAREYVATDSELQKELYDPLNNHTMLDRFGTLPRSFVTLLDFFSLNNLSSKGYDIIALRPLTIFFFLAFALVVPIVLLNLITATLVDMSIRSSTSDKEHSRALALAEWEERIDELKDLYFKITGVTRPKSDKSGTTIGTAFCRSGNSSSDSDDEIEDEVEMPKLSRERLISMCESEEVREHLNLLFGEPQKSQKGMERLLELWVVLDLDEDGEVTLDEFTEGLGRLYDVIRHPNADAFVMMRLVKLHYFARQERLRNQRDGSEERRHLYSDLKNRIDAMDRKIEALFTRFGMTPQVPDRRMKNAPGDLQCADASPKASL